METKETEQSLIKFVNNSKVEGGNEKQVLEPVIIGTDTIYMPKAIDITHTTMGFDNTLDEEAIEKKELEFQQQNEQDLKKFMRLVWRF